MKYQCLWPLALPQIPHTYQLAESIIPARMMTALLLLYILSVWQQHCSLSRDAGSVCELVLEFHI